MKQLLFILPIVFLISGCNKENRARTEQRLQVQFDLPAGLNTLETHIFVIRDINSFFEATLIESGRSASDIDEINSAAANMEFPFTSGNINFLSRLSVRIFPSGRPDEFKEMYYLDFIPNNVNNPLNLFGTIADLTPIIQNGKFDMEVRLNFRTFTQPNPNVRINFGYNVYFK
jgi:hypothetical protein